MEDNKNEFDIFSSLGIESEDAEQQTTYEEFILSNKNENKNFEDVFASYVVSPSSEEYNKILEENSEILEKNEGKPLEHIFLENEEEEKEVVLKWQFLKKIKSFFTFTTGYISTSVVIFAFLLLFSNYSAYFNIVESFIFQGQFKKNEELLINSVEASSLISKEQGNTKDNVELNSANQHSIKRLIAESNKEDIGLDISITPYENRIVIPKISKNVPLLDIKDQTISGQSELNNIFMKELENGVIRYPGSSKPGKDGTTFIFGHSSNFPWIKGDYNDVFALLDNVVKDDLIIIYYNQEKYTYRVKEKKVVKPGDVSVLKKSSGTGELSLMTCWPVGTTFSRLIVVGDLVKE